MGQRETETVVPSLIGLPTEDAHNRALDARLLAVDQDPGHKASTPGTVTAQSPAPGSSLQVGQRIIIWVDGGGDDGGGGGNQPAPVDTGPVLSAGTK